MAVNNKPSFNCATAKRPVQKAICADPALAKTHVGILRIPVAGSNLDSLIVEGFTQEFLQFPQFRFIHDALPRHPPFIGPRATHRPTGPNLCQKSPRATTLANFKSNYSLTGVGARI
jgi:hypothetical protein